MKRILFALAALLALAAACHPEVDPTSVTLNKHDLMLKVGGTEVLEATIEPANATNTALSWSSTAPSVATVDQNGKVTAVSDGNAVIMVATLAGAKTDACNVYVSKNFVSVTGVKLDRATLELKVGDRIGLA
ncbi:MAG: Ig domain-containing protein, partial [Bacteroidales bacterium]|nr:Ig domain-containing protein [Bacteroidales bacterium]